MTPSPSTVRDAATDAKTRAFDFLCQRFRDSLALSLCDDRQVQQYGFDPDSGALSYVTTGRLMVGGGRVRGRPTRYW
jgi:hypothetical protein